MRVVTKRRLPLEHIFSDPPIPLALTRWEGGELVPPLTGTGPGISCGYFCPCCKEGGRTEDESRVQYHERRPRKKGEQPLGHFQHARGCKPPRNFPCYRREWDDEHSTAKANGVMETVLHRFTKELVAWYLDDREPGEVDWLFGAQPEPLLARTERNYPDTRFCADAVIYGERSVLAYLEVVVTHSLGKYKGLHLLKVAPQVLVLNLRGKVDQSRLVPLLLEWDEYSRRASPSTDNDIRALAAAEAAMQYIFNESDIVREVTA